MRLPLPRFDKHGQYRLDTRADCLAACIATLQFVRNCRSCYAHLGPDGALAEAERAVRDLQRALERQDGAR